MSFKQLFAYSQPIVAAATVLAVAVFASAIVAGYTAYAIKVSGDMIEVTGSAKQSVTADFGRWTILLETKTGLSDQQSGYDRLEKAKDSITAYLKEQGYTDVETPVASINANYIYPDRSEPILTGYTVSRVVVVRSENVEGISDLANNIAPLTGNQYSVTSQGLELTYQKLTDTRVALLTEAIADAKARADAIAKETGRGVDMLRSASGGVVQVLPQGSVEISDYGTYDTQNINKEVMVTVRATFSLR